MITAGPPRSVASQAISWGLRLLTAGVLLFAAYGKFSGSVEAVALFEKLGMGAPGRLLIASLETLSALLILSPQSAVYGALLGLGVMIGAVIAHCTMIGVGGMGDALLVAAGCLAILYRHRHDASFLRNLFDR